MKQNWFTNYDAIATTQQRRDALAILNAALNAIDTENVIKSNVRIRNNELRIRDKTLDVSKFKNIKVIGFGKASCKAAYALEQILGQKIQSGIALGLAPVACEIIKTYQGSHPQPSYDNVEISEQILRMSREATEDDLVIVVVSGGGSALLCWPKTECDQAQILYHRFLKVGGTISELNAVRKHISLLKGGGLAKALYPATVIGLIFSDVPGDNWDMIASGSTFKDRSTIKDAQRIIIRYNLGKFNLIETPKDDRFFAKVTNIPMLSNIDALNAMQTCAQGLGYSAKIYSSEVYKEPQEVLEDMQSLSTLKSVILAGGEIRLNVSSETGSGGRNLYLAMQAQKMLNDNFLFISFASDGLDNSSVAGTIVDSQTKKQARVLNLSLQDYIKRFDGYTYFEKLQSLLTTGPTEANVSDLMLLLK